MTQLGKTSLLDSTMTPTETSRPAGAVPKTDWRKFGMVALAFLSVAVMGLVLFRTISRYQNTPGSQSKFRTLVDAETGEVFEDFRVPNGSTYPLKNPKTGKTTLYIGEPCYWTKEGKAKLKPTWVFVKEAMGQPGPNICPDCGRKVTPHNPTPPDSLMIEAAQAAK